MTDEDFAQVVRETIAGLPEEFKSQLDNVEITIEDRPGKEDLRSMFRSPHTILLGLYRGIPKTKRFSYSSLPDKITLFKEPIVSLAHDIDDAKRIIRDTVLHELGHHFGLSDEDLERIKRR